MIKLVAFDWNGTIFADTFAIVDGVNAVFKFLHLRRISLKTFQKYFDVPVKQAYIAMGASSKDLEKYAKEVARVFHESYEQRASKVRTRAFAKQLLNWLSVNNIEPIIFSNHIDEPIKKQLRRLKIEKYFGVVLANSHLEIAFRGRVKLNKLKKYIKSRNLQAKEVLVVGDTIEEVEIGQNLGCVTVAITAGNCSTARLKAAKPDFLIGTLKEVVSIVRNLAG